MYDCSPLNVIGFVTVKLEEIVCWIMLWSFLSMTTFKGVDRQRWKLQLKCPNSLKMTKICYDYRFLTSSCNMLNQFILIFLFCLFFCSARAYQVRQSPKSKTHPPPFPFPHIHTNTKTHTNTHTYSLQQCQGGLISLLPTLTSPASPPQTLEAVPSELWLLTSPLSTWEPEVTCSPSNPGTPSCPARNHIHVPHLQVNQKGKRSTSTRFWTYIGTKIYHVVTFSTFLLWKCYPTWLQKYAHF